MTPANPKVSRFPIVQFFMILVERSACIVNCSSPRREQRNHPHAAPMASPGTRGEINMSRRIGANSERPKQDGLPAEWVNTNRVVLLLANERDPRKTQIRYDRNGRRGTAMKGENVTFSNLHLTVRSGNDIHNCNNSCNTKGDGTSDQVPATQCAVSGIGLFRMR